MATVLLAWDTAGWNVTERLKATFGYNFLYWTEFAPPGNQIDHNNNPGLVHEPVLRQRPGRQCADGHFPRERLLGPGAHFGLELRF